MLQGNTIFKAEDNTKEDAHNELKKENIKEKEKLEGLLKKAEKVLFKAKNIIPILPSEIIIDTAKVTIIHRSFFFSERIHSVAVADISDVFIDTVPLIASINIVDEGFVENIVKVSWLPKRDAERARRIITGLMEAKKEKIDIKVVEDNDLTNKLEQIGNVKETVTSVTKA